MNLKKLPLTVVALGLLSTGAMAETVLLQEDFNGNYTKSFPYVLDHDSFEPHSSIRSIFLNTNGNLQAWWLVRDSQESTDKAMASYSYFSTPGESDKWLVSAPITVPTEGFVLSFDAQSCIVRNDADRLSDLSLFITESLLDPTNLPTVPTYTWTAIPYGESKGDLENDWAHYTYDLSEYSGKTIYLNFLNKNYDKDIIAIDNVKVARTDVANMEVSHSEYTTDKKHTVTVTLDVLPDDGINNWKLTLDDGTAVQEETGASLSKGRHIYTFDVDTKYDIALPFTVTLIADGQVPVVYNGSITQIAFNPQRRVLLEESTSVGCGNCPYGIYLLEEIGKDTELKDKVIAAAVHIDGLGTDYMVNEEHQNFLEFNAAPWVVMNRRATLGFTPAYDMAYDKTNEKSVAYFIDQETKRSTPLDIRLEGDWVIEGTDTVAINAKAIVRSAMTVKNSKYAIGFILLENNVGRDGMAWRQENYFAGISEADCPTRMNGWADFPGKVQHVRYQHVSRAVYGFYGMPNSLPAELPINTDIPFEYKVVIPDVSKKNPSGTLVADDAQRQFMVLVAYVVNTETEEIMNVCKLPMSDVAEDHWDTAKLAEYFADVPQLGTDVVTGEPEYYNLQGVRVSNPGKGIYIVRRGSRVSTEVLR